MKKIMISLVVMFILVGCSKEEPSTTGVISNVSDTASEDVTTTSEEAEDVGAFGELPVGYRFENNGITVPLNVEATPIIEALGEPIEYFEAPSCAFQGLDKIYYYNGFEISTYPSEDKDFISYVNLLDDTVATDQGIYLGSTLEEVIKAYGEEYTENSGSYTYLLGETKLTFIIEEGTVSSITYFAVVEGLNN